MEFSEVIAKRRSVRHFNNKLDVSDEDIRALLEAAVSAPTRRQHPAVALHRRALARGARAARRGAAPALGDRGTRSSSSSRVDPRPCAARYGDRGEQLYAIQDTAAAVENILLAAVDRGLASCWIGAFDEDAVREALGIAAPIDARRDPAGRLLGRVGRPPGAPAARRGHDLAVGGPTCPVSAARRSRSCASSSATATAARSATRARTLVFGVGDPHARVMFIGEAPGKNEDLKGEPFVGAAGKLLDELLAHAGSTRERGLHRQRAEVPPAGQPRPAAEEIETCTPFLREQIRLIDPEVLVTLGNFATRVRAEDRDGHHAPARAGAPWPGAHGAADLPPGGGHLRPHQARRAVRGLRAAAASCSPDAERRDEADDRARRDRARPDSVF